MLYQVVFSTTGVCGSGSKEVDVVTLNGEMGGQLFKDVQSIIAWRRARAHSAVEKWATLPACDMKKASLGLTVTVYKAERHPFTRVVERCKQVYQKKS